MPQREKNIDISAPWIGTSENRTTEKKISEIGPEETQGERRSRKKKQKDSEPAARRRLKPSKDQPPAEQKRNERGQAITPSSIGCRKRKETD
jgi:hypothetical protein